MVAEKFPYTLIFLPNSFYFANTGVKILNEVIEYKKKEKERKRVLKTKLHLVIFFSLIILISNRRLLEY